MCIVQDARILPTDSSLSSLIHRAEDLHRVCPEKTEREVQDMTGAIMVLLTPKDRRILTARYRRKLGI